MSRGAKVTVKCKCCKSEFEARVADRKRGWGKYCSKSCKAKKQEQRTGQHKAYLRNGANEAYYRKEYGGEPQFDRRGNYEGFVAHFSNEDNYF